MNQVIKNPNSSVKQSHKNQADKTFIHYFRESAAMYQNKIAASQGNISITYGMLNEQSDKLARHLLKSGVKKGDFVVQCATRSPNMLIGMLAVMKLSGVYSPIDPMYPEERINYILNDIKPSIILHDSKTSFIKKYSDAISYVNIDEKHPEPETAQSATLESPKMDDTAYIMYTSGTSGNPKGVLITHGGLINHNISCISIFELKKTDIVLQIASIAFDHALEEILPSLIAGSKIQMFEDSDGLTPETISHFLLSKDITVVNMPTSFWNLWVDWISVAKNIPKYKKLRMVAVGGENCSYEKYSKWIKNYGSDIDFFNGYGPTEATIMSSIWKRCAGEGPLELEEGYVPIGKELPNVIHLVLKKDGTECALGESGELYIGGKGVGKGYYKRPQETQERFLDIADKHGRIGRYYKTGDLVKQCKSGDYIYLGRVDNQVKIRGYRVELDDIDYHIKRIDGVFASTSMAVEHESSKYIVSFIISEKSETDKLIKNELSKHLPPYAIPYHIERINSLPLNPNGKVDRNILAQKAKAIFSDKTVEQEDLTHAPAPDPINSELLKIWTKILGVSKAQEQDNFFENGGNSLSLMLLIRKVDEIFGIKLSAKSIIDHPQYFQIREKIKSLIKI